MKYKIYKTFESHNNTPIEYINEYLQASNFHYDCRKYIRCNKRLLLEFLMSSHDVRHYNTFTKSWSLNEFFNTRH